MASIYQKETYECTNCYTHYVHNEDANEYENISYSLKRYGVNLLTFDGIDSLTISAKLLKYLKNVPTSLEVVQIDPDGYEGLIDLSQLENCANKEDRMNIKKIIIEGEENQSINKIINLPKTIRTLEISGFTGD